MSNASREHHWSRILIDSDQEPKQNQSDFISEKVKEVHINSNQRNFEGLTSSSPSEEILRNERYELHPPPHTMQPYASAYHSSRSPQLNEMDNKMNTSTPADFSNSSRKNSIGMESENSQQILYRDAPSAYHQTDRWHNTYSDRVPYDRLETFHPRRIIEPSSNTRRSEDYYYDRGSYHSQNPQRHPLPYPDDDMYRSGYNPDDRYYDYPEHVWNEECKRRGDYWKSDFVNPVDRYDHNRYESRSAYDYSEPRSMIPPPISSHVDESEKEPSRDYTNRVFSEDQAQSHGQLQNNISSSSSIPYNKNDLYHPYESQGHPYKNSDANIRQSPPPFHHPHPHHAASASPHHHSHRHHHHHQQHYDYDYEHHHQQQHNTADLAHPFSGDEHIDHGVQKTIHTYESESEDHHQPNNNFNEKVNKSDSANVQDISLEKNMHSTISHDDNIMSNNDIVQSSSQKNKNKRTDQSAKNSNKLSSSKKKKLVDNHSPNERTRKVRKSHELPRKIPSKTNNSVTGEIAELPSSNDEMYENDIEPEQLFDDSLASSMDSPLHYDLLNYMKYLRIHTRDVASKYLKKSSARRNRFHERFIEKYRGKNIPCVSDWKVLEKTENNLISTTPLNDRRPHRVVHPELNISTEPKRKEKQDALMKCAVNPFLQKPLSEPIVLELENSFSMTQTEPEAVITPSIPKATTTTPTTTGKTSIVINLDRLRHSYWTKCLQYLPDLHKLLQRSAATKISNCKKIAQLCRREVKRVEKNSVLRKTKEVPLRAKRAMKEVLVFWKKNEKEERELRKKAEKEAAEQRKAEEDLREAKRQGRKLNFLITQTELYSHFIGKKIEKVKGLVEGDELDGMATTAPPPCSMDETKEIDFDNEDDEALAQRAAYSAQKAMLAQKAQTERFDQDARKRRLEARNEDMAAAVDTMDFKTTSIDGMEEIEQPKMLTCTLKSYQVKGLNWLANLYEQGINGILADEMGLGKTVQSISLMAYLAEQHNIWGPFLVITPVSTLHNWQQEIAKFAPDLRALPYWGNQKDRKTLRKFWSQKKLYSRDAPFHVLITSYQLVVTDEQHFRRIKWQYMVLDEAQAIKSSSSERWKTLLGFHCRNRLLLTGTPIQNSMQELWALLHFIMPTIFDSHEEFAEWFSKDIESHAENRGTLNQHQLRRLHMILKPFMLRRVKKDVENELGDKIEIDVRCELRPKQRKLYQGLKSKISIADLMQKVTALGDNNESMDSLMNVMMQFRKVCNHPQLFERPEVIAPFQMFDPDTSIYHHRKENGDLLSIPFSARGALKFIIPKLVYRDGMSLSDAATTTATIPHITHNIGNVTITENFNIWSCQHISESFFHSESSSSTFSFLQILKASPSEISQIALSHFLKRLAISIIALRYLHNPIANDLLSRKLSWMIPSNSLSTWATIVADHKLYSPLARLPPFFLPSAVTCPVEFQCSDRSFTYQQNDILHDTLSKAFLLGISDYLHLNQHKQDDQLIHDALITIHDQSPLRGRQLSGILGDSDSMDGFSHIRVPELSEIVKDSGKLLMLDKMLPKLKLEGHRVLIYFQMTRMIDLMEEYLSFRQYLYLRLDGSSTIGERRDMVSDWQTRPELFIFLLSTRAGGLGINLTAADTVIFYDSDWNPTVDQQAMDRAHRLGQTKQVTVYRLITAGTVEERILQRAKQKDEIQKVVISGGAFTKMDFKPQEILSILVDDNKE